MAYIVRFNLYIVISTIFFLLTLSMVLGAGSAGCVSQLESSSGGYNSKPSPLGHQGKYQMGVEAMVDAGFCTLRSGTSAQTSNKTQLWQNCIPTQKAKDAGVTTNADGSINLSSFQGNSTAQEAAYQGFEVARRRNAENYTDKSTGQKHNLYEEYGGKEINGIVMTDEVIDYLVHHGGAGGAYKFLSSNGSNCVADEAVNSSLCKSAQKMNDCINGTTTPGGGGGNQSLCV